MIISVVPFVELLVVTPYMLLYISYGTQLCYITLLHVHIQTIILHVFQRPLVNLYYYIIKAFDDDREQIPELVMKKAHIP